MADLMVDSRSSQSDPVAPQGKAPGDVAPPVDDRKLLAEVDQKYANWRALKRPIEVQWYINAAMTRGLSNIRWNDTLAQLETRAVPRHKLTHTINKILPKVRARRSKFLKNKYTPIVVPATGDKEDKLNAVASQKALEYASRKAELGKTYRKVLNWTLQTGKAFIWVYFDEQAVRQLATEMGPQEAPVGDVTFEAGSPFEVLVPDLGVEHIGDQHEIMRVRAMPLEELKRRYPNVPGIEKLKGDTASSDLFQYQKQIATLSAKTNSGLVATTSDKSDRDLNFVVRKELMTRPCSLYPQGRYVVTAGNLVLRNQNVLPYGFATQKNPFPVVEFTDIELAGQFWPTCTVEQLVGPQSEYTQYRQKLNNHIQKGAHPKIIVSVYSRFPENAWNDEAGEVIRILTPPGAMEPKIITPPQLSQDVYNGLNLVREEIDELSGIPPLMGESGGITSGFQLNLSQEGVESLHAPDIQSHEEAFTELYYKARKIMALTYDVPRLVSVVGRAHIPDVVEFSQNNIDENAEIIVYTGSALSNSPAVRTQQVIELWNSGILQDEANPSEGKRRALGMLDKSGIGEFQEEKRRDEEKARLENLNMSKNVLVNPPIPFDDHNIHYGVHTDQMKSPDFDMWPPEKQKELFAHTLLHMRYINPELAISTALDLGMQEFVPFLLPPQMPTSSEEVPVNNVQTQNVPQV